MFFPSPDVRRARLLRFAAVDSRRLLLTGVGCC
jgi:hypothetical protein